MCCKSANSIQLLTLVSATVLVSGGEAIAISAHLCVCMSCCSFALLCACISGMEFVCVAEASFACLMRRSEGIFRAFWAQFWRSLESFGSILDSLGIPLASFRPLEGPSQKIIDFPGESLPHLETHFVAKVLILYKGYVFVCKGNLYINGWGLT